MAGREEWEDLLVGCLLSKRVGCLDGKNLWQRPISPPDDDDDDVPESLTSTAHGKRNDSQELAMEKSSLSLLFDSSGAPSKKEMSAGRHHKRRVDYTFQGSKDLRGKAREICQGCH